jgi:hypothetical protein
MILNTLGANQTQITLNGDVILFSYNTPVACYISRVTNNIDIPQGWYKTNKKHSKTTSKHINSWYTGEYNEMDQSFFDNLVSGI